MLSVAPDTIEAVLLAIFDIPPPNGEKENPDETSFVRELPHSGQNFGEPSSLYPQDEQKLILPIIIKFFVTVASPVRWLYINRKCGDDFRLSVRRLWLTRIKINDTMPHTCYMLTTQCGYTNSIYTRNRCCPLSFYSLKIATFSNKDCENTFNMSVTYPITTQN